MIVQRLKINALVACRPINVLWDPSADGLCYNSIKLVSSLAGINVFTDFIIMAIPVYTVVHLQMRRSDKVALLCLIFLAIL